jgi:hypothetical protein
MEEAASQWQQSHREDRQHGDHTHYIPRYAKLPCLKARFRSRLVTKLQQEKNDFGEAGRSTPTRQSAQPTPRHQSVRGADLTQSSLVLSLCR